MSARVRIVPGGTSAGKTFGIIPILIDVASRKRFEISIVSESIPHLRKGRDEGLFKDYASDRTLH